MLFVAGMWFQDLWTYDFRRTEMCIIPYATQMGEISFCAYNTGVGWRHIVEKMHQNATVAEWYKEHGKHAVYANPRKAVPLPLRTPPSLHVPSDSALIPIASLKRRPAPSAPVGAPTDAAPAATARADPPQPRIRAARSIAPSAFRGRTVTTWICRGHL